MDEAETKPRKTAPDKEVTDMPEKRNAYFENMVRIAREGGDASFEAPGASKAYWAWRKSINRKADELVMSDYLSGNEVEGFVKALRGAGIDTFVYANQSTAVMQNLHWLVEAGCTMLGLCKVALHEPWFSGNETTDVLGVRFSVN